MITYIAYMEDEDNRLGGFEFLFQAYVDKGLAEVSRWEEDGTEKLRESIKGFLSKYINEEWQLIVVDGKAVYQSRNPYKNSELREKIAQLLNDNGLSVLPPARIYLLSQRGDLDPVHMDNGTMYDVPFNFLPEYASPYRFLVIDVPEYERNMTQRSMFRLMCGVLLIVANEWTDEIIERNYLYVMSWSIDDQEVDEYLSKRVYETRLIEEMIKNILSTGSKNENGSVLPIYQNLIIDLGKSEPVEKFTMRRFHIFANHKEKEAFLWKLRNQNPLDQLESLLKTPIGRWEREITEIKNDMLEDLKAIDAQKTALNISAVNELTDKKEKIEEDIFSIELTGKKQKKLIYKINQKVKQMEILITTRMTRFSFVKSLFEFTVGMLIIGLLCFRKGNTDDKQTVILMIISFLFIALVMIISQIGLGLHRRMVKRKINNLIKKINNSLTMDDNQYNQLLQKIILHKKYSMLEQQQVHIKIVEQQQENMLKRHMDKLDQSKTYEKKLAAVMGKIPNTEKTCSVANIDFYQEPEEVEYYYMPYDRQMCSSVMINIGISTWLPFPFMKQFRLNKECPEKLTISEVQMENGDGRDY